MLLSWKSCQHEEKLIPKERQGTKGEAALGMLAKLIRGDEGRTLLALKICWVRLLRVLGESTKVVFENNKENKTLEEQLREEAWSKYFPSYFHPNQYENKERQKCFQEV